MADKDRKPGWYGDGPESFKTFSFGWWNAWTREERKQWRESAAAKSANQLPTSAGNPFPQWLKSLLRIIAFSPLLWLLRRIFFRR
jgi:hypothetical protein